MTGKQQHSFTHFTFTTVFTDFTFFCKAEMCMPADDTSHKESSSDEDNIPSTLHLFRFDDQHYFLLVDQISSYNC